MFLKGQTVFLRALEPSDADLLYRWENKRDIWPVSFTQIPFSKFILDDFVNASHQDIYTNKQLRLMVGLNENKSTVGILDLFDFDPQHNRCGLGVYIQDDFRKSGLAAEVIDLVKDYVFKTLLLKQIHVDVNVSNTASLALFEKAGFSKVGLKKSWTRIALNDYEDVWLLQLINSEGK